MSTCHYQYHHLECAEFFFPIDIVRECGQLFIFSAVDYCEIFQNLFLFIFPFKYLACRDAQTRLRITRT